MNSRLRHWLLPHKGNKHRPVLLQSRGFFALSILTALWNLFLLGALHIPQLHNVLGYRTEIEPSQVVQSVNNQRRLAGLPALTLNTQLTKAAQDKASDMLKRQYWAHNAPDGTEPWRFIDTTGYEYTVAGENLAKNFSTTDAMVKAWMESPTHQANILHEQYSETGVAIIEGELDGVPTVLVVQMFGKPYEGQPIAITREGESTGKAENLNRLPSDATPDPTTAELLGETTTPLEQPAYSPLQLYRVGLLLILTFLVGVLLHDLWLERKKKLKRQVGKNLAHLVIIIAVIVTLAIAESGVL